MSEKKTLVIDRSKWLRGNVEGGSYLLRPADGRMCCLGFDALACGVTAEQIAMVEAPYTIKGPLPDDYVRARIEHVGIFGWPTLAVRDAMGTNDDDKLTDAEREERLIPILKQLGWDEVVFVDGEPS